MMLVPQIPQDSKWELAVGPMFPVEVSSTQSPRVGLRGSVARSFRAAEDGTLLLGVAGGFYTAAGGAQVGHVFPNVEYRIARPEDKYYLGLGGGMMAAWNTKGTRGTDFGFFFSLGRNLSDKSAVEIRAVRGPREGQSYWSLSYVLRF